MIHVRTPAGKRALAGALEEIAPDVLDSIKLLRPLGVFEEVLLELDDREAMAHLSQALDKAKSAHVAQVRANRGTQ